MPGPLNETELNYAARAPAFERHVWERLVPISQRFALANGNDLIVYLHLRGGERFPIMSVTPGVTWGQFLLEDGSVRLIALAAIEQVILERRPPTDKRQPVGFTVEPDV